MSNNSDVDSGSGGSHGDSVDDNNTAIRICLRANLTA
jgi:hypothetical protein